MRLLCLDVTTTKKRLFAYLRLVWPKQRNRRNQRAENGLITHDGERLIKPAELVFLENSEQMSKI
jgi:hypothetical protein